MKLLSLLLLAAGMAAQSVETVAVSSETLSRQSRVPGELLPYLKVPVLARVTGFVESITVDRGSAVKQGDVLARLVTDTLDAQLAQNAAALAKATAGIAQARSNIVAAEARQTEAKNALERGRPLRQSGVISEASQDSREAAAKTAEAQLVAARDALKVAEADKAQVEAVRRDLEWRRSRADVRAPADGVISRRVAKLGGYAVGSADAMFRIVARGEVELDAEVPETLVGRIREGQPVSVETSGGGTFTGKVRLVSPEIDRATRLGRVRVFLGDDPQLNVGGFARGLVTVAQSSGLGVPSGAIMYSGTGPVVQVVKDGKVVTRPVVVGLAAGGRTEIKTGLAAGDLVVSRAGTFLREGDAVRPILPAQKVTETTR